MTSTMRVIVGTTMTTYCWEVNPMTTTTHRGETNPATANVQRWHRVEPRRRVKPRRRVDGEESLEGRSMRRRVDEGKES